MFAALRIPSIGFSTESPERATLEFCHLFYFASFFYGSCRVPGDDGDRSSQIEPFDLI
jgi:hypothetical protein